MKSTKGKLLNRDTKEELPFYLNPTDFKLVRSFHYEIEPCLGKPASLVSFQSGGASELTFQLIYDTDAEPTVDTGKLDKFLQSLNRVNDKTKSVSVIEFSMGSFSFPGYVKHFVYHPTRFSSDGAVTSVTLDFTLLSNGDYENGRGT